MTNEALNEMDVRRIVQQEVAPLRRKMSDKRLRKLIAEETQPIVDRLGGAEKDIALLTAGYELTRETISERFGQIEQKLDVQRSQIIDKLDEQHGETLARLDKAEGWINRRTVVERSIVRYGGAALWLMVKRWLPFVALTVGVLSLTYMLLMIVEG